MTEPYGPDESAEPDENGGARWWGIVDLVGGVLLLVMVALVILSVLGRSLPSVRIPNADQMLPDLLVWLAMLGTAAGIRRSEHLGITVLLTKLPPPVRRVVVIAVLIGAVAFFVPLLVRGIGVVRLGMDQGLSSPAGYPAWLIALAIPVGAAASIGYVGWHIYRQLRGTEEATTAKETMV